MSGLVDQERLDAGLAALRELGYEPVEAENLRLRYGVFAGTDEERLRGFHRLAGDPEIRAILFARGGHGLLRILGSVDWELLAEHPRAYVGYSDLTPFLLHVNQRLALVSFHGPMVTGNLARGLSDAERQTFRSALEGRFPIEIPLGGIEPERDAVGRLSGGCLSLLTATLGTPFAPDLSGSVLFWEDVQEPWYRLDRMLTHLRLSGTLDRISAMVVGDVECSDGRSWRDLLSGMSVPVAWGAPAGHGPQNLTLPLGATARLHAARRRLVVGDESGAA